MTVQQEEKVTCLIILTLLLVMHLRFFFLSFSPEIRNCSNKK